MRERKLNYHVRLDPADLATLKAISEKDGRKTSEVIRAALLLFFSLWEGDLNV